MNFSTEVIDGGTVLRIGGELDAISVTDLRPTIDGLGDHDCARIVVDLSKLRLIDSSGVGALVALYKRVRARGGQVSVQGLCEQPLAIFQLLQLDRILTTWSDRPTG